MIQDREFIFKFLIINLTNEVYLDWNPIDHGRGTIAASWMENTECLGLCEKESK